MRNINIHSPPYGSVISEERMKDVYWLGPPPAKCELCGKDIKDKFIDGRTFLGPWAIQCTSCFFEGTGVGRLGVGNGQEYVKQADNTWKKVRG